jgi:hypothetical protein
MKSSTENISDGSMLAMKTEKNNIGLTGEVEEVQLDRDGPTNS